MKRLKKCSPLNLHYASRANITEYIRAGLEFHKEVGFEAADFGMGMIDFLSDGWKRDIESAVESSREIGIGFDVCHLPFIGGGGKKDEEFYRQFDIKMHNAIDAAVLLGSEYAVLHPTSPTVPLKSFNRAEAFDAVMAHLAPYAEHASRVGLNIVVENMRVIPGMRLSHRYCQDPDELCDIADALGIGVCWDFGHANISGIKQSEGLSYVGRRLKVIHVNDNSGIDDDHVAPFTGNVDWRDAMKGLAICGYEGVFNYELATGRLPESTRKAYAGYLISAADELMSYIEE